MQELYTIRRRNGGRYFEEVVSASSRAEAEAIASRMNGELTGTLFDESPIEHDDYSDDDFYD